MVVSASFGCSPELMEGTVRSGFWSAKGWSRVWWWLSMAGLVVTAVVGFGGDEGERKWGAWKTKKKKAVDLGGYGEVLVDYFVRNKRPTIIKPNRKAFLKLCSVSSSHSAAHSRTVSSQVNFLNLKSSSSISLCHIGKQGGRGLRLNG
ncbi:hypothetical protein HAX54_032415, partial [Datura stramonium]|nr:hypothetical protein [Datura stramonium]